MASFMELGRAAQQQLKAQLRAEVIAELKAEESKGESAEVIVEQEVAEDMLSDAHKCLSCDFIAKNAFGLGTHVRARHTEDKGE